MTVICGLTLLLSTVCLITASTKLPPRIVKQPPSGELLFTVTNMTPFVLECAAEGLPTPKYRWEKNGNPFIVQHYDDRISQQPGVGTLVFATPRDEDAGQYQCFAENEWGVATSNSLFARNAVLGTFKDSPPVVLSINEGDPFHISCKRPHGWPIPKLYWIVQNTDGRIKSINNSRITLDPKGSLWFSNVTREDASVDFAYACAATSGFLNVYNVGNRVLLNVNATGMSASENKQEPIQQYVTRKNEVAIRGESMELYCIFSGTPLPQTVWSKNGEPIRQSERITQRNYAKSLNIKGVRFEDEGVYGCEVSNGVGYAKSYSINLRVNAYPYFTQEPEVALGAEGGTVEINCKASGVPAPDVTWTHNGRPIRDATANPRRNVTWNKITIENLAESDIGNYGCNATNTLGYVYKDVYVNILQE